jgi:predicted transcriptional regulator
MRQKSIPDPTARELQILEVLWRHGEATVRQVYEELREELGIVQNTVQAFLRTMTDKGLVRFRKSGRTFVYRSMVGAEATRQRLLGGVMQRVYDGALDQFVAAAVSLKGASPEELGRLRALLDRIDAEQADAEHGDGTEASRAGIENDGVKS